MITLFTSALYEGLDEGGGGTNVSCQLKFRPFIRSQLDFLGHLSVVR